ncbi:MAG: type II toxin-antitoxin system HicB family antitoxin [Pirellulales bacterium]|nr:type II toxin-antitoxin system HicB family antitoxin [Pirellulales bacterium]
MIREERFGSEVAIPVYHWEPLSERAYECRVLIRPEPEGGFSAFALRLPGVASQGETEAEALVNIADAFEAALQCYLESGDIPWKDAVVDRTAGCMERWILVNV